MHHLAPQGLAWWDREQALADGHYMGPVFLLHKTRQVPRPRLGQVFPMWPGMMSFWCACGPNQFGFAWLPVCF